MLNGVSGWKEKKKTEYVSLKVLYEQGKTGNHGQSKAFDYDSFLKTKQGQLHYIKRNEWMKQYLSFKVGQIIVLHPQKHQSDEGIHTFTIPQLGKIVESQPTDQQLYRVRLGYTNPKEITISPVDSNTFSTDVFTKHLFDCKSFDNEWTVKEKMDLLVQTFQTARKNAIFPLGYCKWGQNCYDERPGHLMHFVH